MEDMYTKIDENTTLDRELYTKISILDFIAAGAYCWGGGIHFSQTGLVCY